MRLLKKLFRDEGGQGLIEYVLIIGLIALVVVGVIVLVGGQIANVWNKVNEELGQVPGSTSAITSEISSGT